MGTTPDSAEQVILSFETYLDKDKVLYPYDGPMSYVHHWLDGQGFG